MTSDLEDDRPKQESWNVFLCYRQTDGMPVAEWLNEHLNGRQAPLTLENPPVLDIYFDQDAAAVSNWHDLHRPALQKAKAIIVICSPGAASRRGKVDFVHMEIDWWMKHSKVAPILIDTTGEGETWVPAKIKRRWPNAQRVDVRPADWSGLPKEDRERYEARAVNRILDGIVLSESRVRDEELERRSRQQKLLQILLGTAMCALLIAGWALWQSQADRKSAIDSSRRAEEAKAKSLMTSIGHARGPIGEVEFAALWGIAGEEEAVRLLIFKQALSNKDTAEQLERRVSNAVHAIAGMDPDARRAMVGLLDSLKDHDDWRILRSCFFCALELRVNDESLPVEVGRNFIRSAYKANNAEADEGVREAIELSLESLSSEDAFELAAELIDGAAAPEGESRRARLSPVLQVSKIVAAERLGELAIRIVALIPDLGTGGGEQANEVLQALAPRLNRESAFEVASALVAGAGSENGQSFGLRLAPLSKLIRTLHPKQTVILGKQILGLVGRVPENQREAAYDVLREIAERTDAQGARDLANELVEGANTETGDILRRRLAPILKLAKKLQPQQLRETAGQLLALANDLEASDREEAYDTIRYLVEHMDAQGASLVQELIAGASGETGEALKRRLGPFLKIAKKLDPQQVRKTAGQLLKLAGEFEEDDRKEVYDMIRYAAEHTDGPSAYDLAKELIAGAEAETGDLLKKRFDPITKLADKVQPPQAREIAGLLLELAKDLHENDRDKVYETVFYVANRTVGQGALDLAKELIAGADAETGDVMKRRLEPIIKIADQLQPHQAREISGLLLELTEDFGGDDREEVYEILRYVAEQTDADGAYDLTKELIAGANTETGNLLRIRLEPILKIADKLQPKQARETAGLLLELTGDLDENDREEVYELIRYVAEQTDAVGARDLAKELITGADVETGETLRRRLEPVFKIGGKIQPQEAWGIVGRLLDLEGELREDDRETATDLIRQTASFVDVLPDIDVPADNELMEFVRRPTDRDVPEFVPIRMKLFVAVAEELAPEEVPVIANMLVADAAKSLQMETMVLATKVVNKAKALTSEEAVGELELSLARTAIHFIVEPDGLNTLDLPKAFVDRMRDQRRQQLRALFKPLASGLDESRAAVVANQIVALLQVDLATEARKQLVSALENVAEQLSSSDARLMAIEVLRSSSVSTERASICEILAANLRDNDAFVFSREVINMISNDSSHNRALIDLVANLASQLTDEAVLTLATELVQSIPKTSSVQRLSATVSAFNTMIGRLGPDHSKTISSLRRELGKRIVGAIERVYGDEDAMKIDSLLGALAGSLGPEDSVELLRLCSERLEMERDERRIVAYSTAVLTLARSIGTDDDEVASVLKRANEALIRKIVDSSSFGQQPQLEAVFVDLLKETRPQDVRKVAANLLVRLEEVKSPAALAHLSNGLSILLKKTPLSGSESSSMARRAAMHLIAAMHGNGEWVSDENRKRLADIVKVLADRLSPQDALTVLGREPSNGDERAEYTISYGYIFLTLVSRCEQGRRDEVSERALKFARLILTAAMKSHDGNALTDLASLFEKTAANLTPAQARRIGEEIVVPLRDKESWQWAPRLEFLLGSYQVLPEFGTDDAAAASSTAAFLAARLVEEAPTASADQLDFLRKAFRRICSKLGSLDGLALARQIVEKLDQETSPSDIAVLADMFGDVSVQLESAGVGELPALVAAAAERISETLRTEVVISSSRKQLITSLLRLASFAPPGKVGEMLLSATKATSFSADWESLKLLHPIFATLSTSDARRVAQIIVQSMELSRDETGSTSLVEALKVLSRRMDSTSAHRVANDLISASGRGGGPAHDDALRLLGAKLTEAQLIDLLKIPTGTAANRRTILAMLGRSMNQEFGNVWKLVGWLRENDRELYERSQRRLEFAE